MIARFFFTGISELELLSGVMFIHSTQTLGICEVCHLQGTQVEKSNVVCYDCEIQTYTLLSMAKVET